MSVVRVSAFVDRFEDDEAVLLLAGDELQSVVWPRGLLPADVAEGTVLELTLEIDTDATADRSTAIRRLLSDLSDSV